MNSFDDININSNEWNDNASLKKRIDDLNNWIDNLDKENHSYRRRLWMHYEYMFDLAYVMERIVTEYGEDNIKAIIDEYFDNYRQDALRKERHFRG